MKRIHLFTAFHFNLNYSSLTIEYLSNLIKYGYKQLISLLKTHLKNIYIHDFFYLKISGDVNIWREIH